MPSTTWQRQVPQLAERQENGTSVSGCSSQTSTSAAPGATSTSNPEGRNRTRAMGRNVVALDGDVNRKTLAEARRRPNVTAHTDCVAAVLAASVGTCRIAAPRRGNPARFTGSLPSPRGTFPT